MNIDLINFIVLSMNINHADEYRRFKYLLNNLNVESKISYHSHGYMDFERKRLTTEHMVNKI